MGRWTEGLGRGLAALAIALALGSTASAGWLETRDQRLLLMTDANEERARYLAWRLTIFRLGLQGLVPMGRQTAEIPTSAFAIDVRYWTGIAQSPGVLGAFVSSPDRDYLVLDRGHGNADAGELLFKMHTRQLHKHTTRVALPAWWTIGVAEFFSTLDESDGSIEFGRYPRSTGAPLADVRLVPLGEILRWKLDPDEANELPRPSPFTGRAWLMVQYFLVGNPQRGKQALQYLELVDAGVPIDTAVERAFGVSVDELEMEIQRYQKSRDRRIFLMRVDALPDIDDIVLTPLPEAVALARLALAAQPFERGATVSRQFIDRARKIDPGQPLVIAAQAMQASVERRPDEVRDLVRRVGATADAEARYAASKAMLRQILWELEPGAQSMIDKGFSYSQVMKLRDSRSPGPEQSERLREARGVFADLAGEADYELGAALAVIVLDALLDVSPEVTLPVVRSAAIRCPGNVDLADYEARLLLRLDRREQALAAFSRAAENARSGDQRQLYVALMRDLD